MPLSWNEIRSRAHEFSRRWAGEESERAEAQSFWNEFFAIFGLDRRRVASFEKQVRLCRAGEKLKNGRIDAFWKGTLLIEHKSAGQDLDRAFAPAIDYFEGLPERDLPKRVKHFAFVAGYRTQEIAPLNPVNIHAAERMGQLHDLLKASGYGGHALEV
ncbi:MAG TPA: type IIL restriction-modification enzyme MmeI, partial [Rhodocyclaceae bacterium]|nr:type IIL restriction-modification enzyme MmeI [Rhodocyclaceae bacterium]